MPAVVVEVLVAPGDAVADGQKLVLLESMKMVLPIVAPHAGVVTAVRCAPGDAVQPGVPLVELDRAAGGATES
ncbi:MAG: acetyl-CoA carboxylase biotin carboxyl carrier protein subunit [Chloroflexi bacterium CFX6]|nr:acetyl-CoA carboxylase biotin carboxyl carrier protein subunit [Chloroflexi bacterium CFX6]